MVDATGEPLPQPSIAPKVPKKRGPKPTPFAEMKVRSRQRAAALIAKGRDPEALMQAAASKIGKVSPDKGYVMKLMQRDPEKASEIKKWHKNKKKNRYF